jgi:hypothetical protein
MAYQTKDHPYLTTFLLNMPTSLDQQIRILAERDKKSRTAVINELLTRAVVAPADASAI